MLDNVNLEVVNEAKLLGTHITDDLKWDVNTRQIIRKSNARMQLLRKLASFGASTMDLKHIYIIYIRSALEHSSSVWHKSLTKENESDLERVQKSSLRIILNSHYISYENALNTLGLETLKDRREKLFRKFAENCVNIQQMNTIVSENRKIHPMITRQIQLYENTNTNTERFKNSAGIQIQKYLNEN